MPFDYEMATRGIVNAIQRDTELRNQRTQIETALILEAVKEKRAEEAKRQERESLTPGQQVAAMAYKEANPDTDWSGFPGYGRYRNYLRNVLKNPVGRM